MSIDRVRTKIPKLSVVIIFAVFIALSVPFVDLMISVENSPYIHIDNDKSFLAQIYIRNHSDYWGPGIGYPLFDNYYDACYHMYGFKSCFGIDNILHYLRFPVSLPLLVFTLFTVTSDIKRNKINGCKLKVIIYTVIILIEIALCIYGIFIFAPTYYEICLDEAMSL